ncbi:hypothetical protein [Planobispora rosea]|uniref:hypothetical protein n=1 Tax=Planobispora rosea TaxID=35762 RepID=UPI00083A8794|nr:hypothetical protein [Planobispora rosea]
MNRPARLLTTATAATATAATAAAAFATLALAAAPAQAMPAPAPTPTASSTAVPGATASAAPAAAAPATPVTIPYTCAAPLGTGSPTPAQVSATVPATALVGQPLAVEWNVSTGLLAPDVLAAGAVLHKGTLKVAGSASGAIETTSAGNPAAIGKGQALQLPAMKATYTPAQPGPLSLIPGDVTLTLTRNGIAQETRCSPDPAAAPLATLAVAASGSAPGGVPVAAPAPTVTITVTATPAPVKKAAAQATIIPKGGAPTGGGALAADSPWPYAALGVGLLFAAGLGWEIRRKRIHGY